MKLTNYLTIFFTLFIFQLSAQHLEIGNKWIYDVRYYLGAGHYTETFDSIEIVSDTMINNFSYYKLIISDSSPCGVFGGIEYLREDDNKIYRLSGSGAHDDLMIDYDASGPYIMNYEISGQSDLIETNVIQDSTGVETLPDGSTISVIYNRIINNSSFDDNAVYKLVDKIGYIQYGFLFPNIGTGLCDPFDSHNLRCFISQNDTIHLTEFDCFESSKKVSTKDIEVKEFTISPNPSDGMVTLPDNFDKAVIYDVSGKRLNVQINGLSLDLSNLKNGFYILQLRKNNDSAIYSSKFVKI